MASGKLTPRQKMINMMYLVLTALLALNVSKEVLNSFFEVNKGIVKTTNTIEDKSNSKYGALESLNKAKSQPYLDLTDQIKPIANNLALFIQEMKYDLVYTADGGEVYLCDNPNQYEPGNDESNKQYLNKDQPFSEIDQSLKISYLYAKENREASGFLFNPENKKNGKIFEETGKGRATVLKEKINEYKSFLINLLRQAEKSEINFSSSPNKLISEIEKTLEIKDGNAYGEKNKKVSWENYNFYDMPAVSALTLLSKWQADIRNVEADVVSFIANSVGAEDLKFTGAKATALPSSNYITSGDEFSAEIFVTAFNEDLKPEVYIGDYTVSADSTEWVSKSKVALEIVNGKGIYKKKTSGRGNKSYKGFIKLPQADNSNKYYPFEGEYTVAPPSSAVSPDYMLAMFVDQKNPITVSAAGQDLKNVNISINQGTKKKSGNGEWIITPSKTGKLTVSVSGINAKGSRIRLGSTDFQVYPVPPPVISINGISDKTKEVNASDIINAGLLSAKKEGFIKVFKGLTYRVNSFKLSIANLKKGKSTGPRNAIRRLDDAASYLRQANSGDIVTITDIYYSVNGKKTRYKNDIIKKIK